MPEWGNSGDLAACVNVAGIFFFFQHPEWRSREGIFAALRTTPKAVIEEWGGFVRDSAKPWMILYMERACLGGEMVEGTYWNGDQKQFWSIGKKESDHGGCTSASCG